LAEQAGAQAGAQEPVTEPPPLTAFEVLELPVTESENDIFINYE